jgi:DNA-binding phage protein
MTEIWDPAEHLATPEAIAAYVAAALADGDRSLLAAVLDDVVRAKQMGPAAARP